MLPVFLLEVRRGLCFEYVKKKERRSLSDRVFVFNVVAVGLGTMLVAVCELGSLARLWRL